MDEQPQTVTEPAAEPETRAHLAQRVHVDLPRVLPEQMSTAQAVEAPRDPQGGRDGDTEFMLRNAGF